MGDPALLRKARKVEQFGTGALDDLVQDMLDTMLAAEGVGLAAPQIGVDLRVVIFGFQHNDRYPDAPAVPFTVLINPEIEPLSDEQTSGWEGCLSLPELRGYVPRYTHIHYRGMTPAGEPIAREAEGFHARVVQHEFDHLDGILYPSRMDSLHHFGYSAMIPRQETPAKH